jgi:hypothetical protein
MPPQTGQEHSTLTSRSQRNPNPTEEETETMKKLIYVAALLVASLSAYAQGTVAFNNRSLPAIDAPVFDVGGTVRLDGAAWFAQLYAGPVGTADTALAAIGSPTTFRTGAGAGYINAVSEIIVPGVAVGGTARIQMRAWDATFGTYAAAQAGNGKIGSSSSFDVANLGGQGPAGPPAVPATLVGLTTFSLTQVPEPSTIALGALGVAALLFRRRK